MTFNILTTTVFAPAVTTPPVFTCVLCAASLLLDRPRCLPDGLLQCLCGSYAKQAHSWYTQIGTGHL